MNPIAPLDHSHNLFTKYRLASLSGMLLIGLMQVAQAQTAPLKTAPLSLKTYVADANSFSVTSTLITGKTDAILVDAQFTFADAHRVVADILESGKTLKTIYVSHGDPDYYFGLQVLHEAFPSASIVATQATVDHIRDTAQKKLDTWESQLGNNGPKNVLLPNVLKTNRLELEGQTLNIVTPLSERPEWSYLFVPSLKAVIGGVLVYGGDQFVWTADAAKSQDRTAWIKALDYITASQPRIVIPGHAAPNAAYNLSSVVYTRTYLKAFEQAFSQSKTSTELIKLMKAQYPKAQSLINLELGAKVATGEMKW